MQSRFFVRQAMTRVHLLIGAICFFCGYFLANLGSGHSPVLSAPHLKERRVYISLSGFVNSEVLAKNEQFYLVKKTEDPSKARGRCRYNEKPLRYVYQWGEGLALFEAYWKDVGELLKTVRSRKLRALKRLVLEKATRGERLRICSVPRRVFYGKI